ncbi:hypothetical protein QL285_068520 [Trifolium repens]|nr:hypothetical protein QL285_068520 [Trifolium repens]
MLDNGETFVNVVFCHVSLLRIFVTVRSYPDFGTLIFFCLRLFKREILCKYFLIFLISLLSPSSEFFLSLSKVTMASKMTPLPSSSSTFDDDDFIIPEIASTKSLYCSADSLANVYSVVGDPIH